MRFTKFKVKKYKQKQTKNRTEKKAHMKRKTISMWLLSTSFDLLELLVVLTANTLTY